MVRVNVFDKNILVAFCDDPTYTSHNELEYVTVKHMSGIFCASKFPLTDADLMNFHIDVARAFERGMPRLGEVIAFFFGENEAERAMFSLLGIDPSRPGKYDFKRHDGQYDWRGVLNDMGRFCDTVDCTQLWRDAAQYGGQGITPHAWQHETQSDRENAIRQLLAEADKALIYGAFIVGDDFNFVWNAVKARGAIDFKIGRLSLDDLCLLSGLSLQIVRNAVSVGALAVDDDQTVAPDDAQAWLQRRRGFISSRWLDPDDDQFPQGKQAEEGTEKEFVPQTASGERFLPEQVMRMARERNRLSITVGAKGEEEKFNDFYAALQRLKELPLARWRRPNASGNWGLVSARGPWVAVEKAEIDRQIAAKRKEIGP